MDEKNPSRMMRGISLRMTMVLVVWIKEGQQRVQPQIPFGNDNKEATARATASARTEADSLRE